MRRRPIFWDSWGQSSRGCRRWDTENSARELPSAPRSACWNKAMKVLISDALAPEGIEILSANKDLQVVHRPGIKGEALFQEIQDAAALIVRSGTQVSAEVLDHAKSLKIIGRAGAGVDNIDCV